MSSARVLAAGMSVLLAACATPQRDFSDHLASDSPPVRLCAQWYRELDAQVDAAGVRDAQYTPVGGFPYLRVDRFHAALRPRAEASESALHAFVERLLELEGESRRHEIDNLPPEALAALPGALQEARPRAAVLRQTLECARLLRERDLASPQARTAMLERAHVPDDYSMANRILGLYPLTRIAFSAGIRRWQETVAQEFERELEPRSEALVVRYAPPPSPPLPRSRVEALLARAHLDTLGVPAGAARDQLRAKLRGGDRRRP
jgi:hypothetical protein